jgi:hypothetical protein
MMAFPRICLIIAGDFKMEIAYQVKIYVKMKYFKNIEKIWYSDKMLWNSFSDFKEKLNPTLVLI